MSSLWTLQNSFIKKNIEQSQNEKLCETKSENKSSFFKKFNKWDIREHQFGTLISTLYCYCEDKVKYGLLSKHVFQRKQQHDSGKNLNIYGKHSQL